MKKYIFTVILSALFLSYNLMSQNLVEGSSKTLLYKNGSLKNSELKISMTETVSIKFTPFGLELYYSNSKLKRNILNVEETDDWDVLQICIYDFDKNKVNDLIIAYGNKLTNLTIHVFNKEYGQYKSIGVFEGQDKCYIDKNQIIVPYGSQGLFDEYTYRLGEINKTN
jgi:hypothetical protein